MSSLEESGLELSRVDMLLENSLVYSSKTMSIHLVYSF